jgi:hypothetical protein
MTHAMALAEEQRSAAAMAAVPAKDDSRALAAA